MGVRTAVLITAGVIGAITGGTVVGAALTDPTVTVGPVEIDDISAAPVPTRPPSPDAEGETTATTTTDSDSVVARAVEGLEQLVGVLDAGRDSDEWFVSGVEVDFGPDGWVDGPTIYDDFDGDGTKEPLLAELQGLAGRTITLGVRYEFDDDRDDADVYIIEGLTYRDPAGGDAPWQIAAIDSAASPEEIAAAAASAVGPGAAAIDIDPEHDGGWTGWDVDVRAADGTGYQVYVDLAGNVLDVRPDPT